MTTLALATLVSSCRISKGGKHITHARERSRFFPDASVCLPGEWMDKGRDYRARLLMATKRTQTQAIHMNATEGVCGALVSINHDKCHHIRRLLGDASSVFEAGI